MGEEFVSKYTSTPVLTTEADRRLYASTGDNMTVLLGLYNTGGAVIRTLIYKNPHCSDSFRDAIDKFALQTVPTKKKLRIKAIKEIEKTYPSLWSYVLNNFSLAENSNFITYMRELELNSMREMIFFFKWAGQALQKYGETTLLTAAYPQPLDFLKELWSYTEATGPIEEGCNMILEAIRTDEDFVVEGNREMVKSLVLEEITHQAQREENFIQSLRREMKLILDLLKFAAKTQQYTPDNKKAKTHLQQFKNIYQQLQDIGVPETDFTQDRVLEIQATLLALTKQA